MTNKEAIEIFQRMRRFYQGELFTDFDKTMKQALDLAINALEQRPQGEWIIIKSPLSTETVVKCPFCHDEFIGNDVEHYNFCPICGADLRGKEE